MLNQSAELSNFNTDFINRMILSPDLIVAQQQKIRSCELPPAYESLRNFISPWPVVINDKIVRDMRGICQVVTSLLHKSLFIISEDYFDFSVAAYGIDISNLIFTNRNSMDVHLSVGRYDAIMTKGNFKLIEYNAGTNIGGWHLLRCVEIYRDIVGGGGNLVCTPILEKFLKLVYQMTNNDKCNAVPSVKLLFVLDSTDAVEDLRTSLPFFKMALVELDLDISIFWTQSLDDVSVSDTGVFFHNKKMDVLSFPVFQFDYHDPKIEMMVSLHQQKKVVFPDMPAFLIAGYKSNFANLHWLNNCGKFDKSESAFINKFIPATYHLSDELNSVINQDLSWLYREVEQNKDNFVIKRDGYFGGDHVYVGRFMTDTSWRNILSAARKSKDWIVQQYCPSDNFYAPEPDGKLALHNYIFGFFNFGGDYGGAGVRLMKTDTGSGVVNSAKGAQYTSIFEVPAQSIFI